MLINKEEFPKDAPKKGMVAFAATSEDGKILKRIFSRNHPLAMQNAVAELRRSLEPATLEQLAAKAAAQRQQKINRLRSGSPAEQHAAIVAELEYCGKEMAYELMIGVYGEICSCSTWLNAMAHEDLGMLRKGALIDLEHQLSE